MYEYFIVCEFVDVRKRNGKQTAFVKTDFPIDSGERVKKIESDIKNQPNNADKDSIVIVNFILLSHQPK